MKQFYLIPLLLVILSANAQVGIGTETPHPSAKLEVSSSSQGLLPPRMTEEQRDLISAPAQGLMVYCSNCGTNGELQVFNGDAWTNLVGGAAAAGPPIIPSVTNPTTGRIWMDRNLGASQVATSSSDVNSYGYLYQWGRGTDGHQIRTSTNTVVLSNNDVPVNANFILATNAPYNWRSPENINLWQGVNGVNNPCPGGYRLPTVAEWEAEFGSWTSNYNSAGALASPLKLPVAGYRNSSSGSLGYVGSRGYYWSSTVSSTNSLLFSFTSNSVLTYSTDRAFGCSVRCIKD
jgi:uncharacterized protein (TIGR02145 family)